MGGWSNFVDKRVLLSLVSFDKFFFFFSYLMSLGWDTGGMLLVTVHSFHSAIMALGCY